MIRPVVEIYLVHVEVPIDLSPAERKRRGRDDRPATVSLELDSRGGRVWDNVRYGLCGAQPQPPGAVPFLAGTPAPADQARASPRPNRCPHGQNPRPRRDGTPRCPHCRTDQGAA